MPLCPWLLSSLLVSQLGGNPSVPVTVAPPTASPGRAGGSGRNRSGQPPLLAGQFSANRLRPWSNDGMPLHRTISPPCRCEQRLPNWWPTPSPCRQAARSAASRFRWCRSSRRCRNVQRQIEAVHAYWRLAEALGEYHFVHERQQRLARLRAGNGEAADLRTARAIAAAQLREAEVQVTTAQHDLAEILLLVPGTPLPLPADQPLVGPYRTLFAELFAGKNAPQHVRTLDQTLPLRNRAVESHAAALLAAEDALDAAIELQASGQERLAGVLAALDAQARQQRAFLAAVCRYNHDIADYALAVVSPQTSPDLLVGTLIKLKPMRCRRNAVTPLPTTATLPAAYQQPIVAPAGPASQ